MIEEDSNDERTKKAKERQDHFLEQQVKEADERARAPDEEGQELVQDSRKDAIPEVAQDEEMIQPEKTGRTEHFKIAKVVMM